MFFFCRGQTPAEADLNLLETARRCELYGMKMHQAKDIEGVPLNLAVAHMGIAVFQGITRLNTFSWAKIRKISFKRKRFLVKLHPEGHVRLRFAMYLFHNLSYLCLGLLQGYCRVLLRRSQRMQKLLEEMRRESRILSVIGCTKYAQKKS